MEDGTRVGWIWKKGVSVGKKLLTVCFLVFSAPFLVPALVVASTIALILSIPYCVFLASYVCIEKLMRKLLPATAFGGRCDHKMILLPNKINARVAISEPILFQIEEERTIAIAYREDEDMTKELRSWLESIRDEGKNNQLVDRGISKRNYEEEEKDQLIVPSDAKLENVRGRPEDLLAGKKQVSMTRSHEGEVESTTTKASRGKDMENSSNLVKVSYSEEQIWTKIEALRKVVGYSVARSPTYSEELKALYMFTGVDLPTSTLENQDIAKIHERLSFLMSVIGIK